jgi:hypothetical protein
MSLISFNWNNKLLLIFLQSFLLFILNLDSNFKIFQIENNLIENIFNYNLIKSISIFTIFIYLFSIIQSKSIKKKFFLSFQKENNLLIIENRKTKSKKLFSKLNLLFLILILFFMYIFKFICDFLRIKYKIKTYRFELEGFCFLIFIIFSKLILKINFYKHQFFAMFLSIFISIIIFIYEYEINFLIYKIINFTYLALIMTLIKFVMIRFYFSPYLILFYDGLISFFICFSIEIYNLISNKENNFLKFVEEKKFFFIIFISNFIISILNIIIIYFFSPIFEILAYVLLSFLLQIKEILKEKNEKNVFLFVLNVVYLICCLIITEIIVLNCFGFNKNTVFNIKERNKNEFETFINEETISFSLINDGSENKENENENNENEKNNENII